MFILKVLLFCTVFAIAYSWVLVWILERKEKKYGQAMLSFTDAFLTGALVLVIVYVSNILVFIARPGAALTYNITLVTLLAAFCLYKETAYKVLDGRLRQRRLAEVRRLETHIAKDPANAACFERLSEVYEMLGEKGQALDTARMAARLEPTARNRWRIKFLEGKK